MMRYCSKLIIAIGHRRLGTLESLLIYSNDTSGEPSNLDSSPQETILKHKKDLWADVKHKYKVQNTS
jgi:hypothetical protein